MATTTTTVTATEPVAAPSSLSFKSDSAPSTGHTLNEKPPIPLNDTAPIAKAEPGHTVEHGPFGPYYEPVAPQSVVLKKIVGEACALLGGPAAVMLQVAAKGVGKGVHKHSSFKRHPIQRGRRTLFYILVMTFGTEEERKFVTNATHAAHARVKGEGYDADDVDLQLWVAATIYWALITGYEEVFGKLDAATAEQAHKEFSVMATGLGVPPEKWPKDRKAFQEYWDKTVAELEVTDEAREVAQDIMYPLRYVKNPFLWLYFLFVWPIMRIVTTEILPPRVRNQLDFPSSFIGRSIYFPFRKTNSIFYPLIPKFIRHLPKDIFMMDFRRRVKYNKSL